jgi:tetratricopeptide (TPR) repeat protein/DNA-binding NarL/FixJ family response regulator
MNKTSLLFFVLVFNTHLLFSQQTPVDSIPIMKEMLKKQIPDDKRLTLFAKLCALYWNLDPDSALYFGWKGLPMLKKEVREVTRGKLHFVLGMAWEYKGNFDSSMWYLRRAAEIYDGLGERRHYYRALEQIGSLYRVAGQYDTAVALMERSLIYFRETNNAFQIMSALTNIGSLYIEQNRYNKALAYYLEASSYDSLLQDTVSMATHLLGIGDIYLNLAGLYRSYNPERSRQYYNLSIAYFNRGQHFFEESNHKTGVCYTLMSLLSAYLAEDKISQADSLLSAHPECTTFPDKRVSSSMQLYHALILARKGRTEDALRAFEQTRPNKDQLMVLPEYHEAMLQLASLLEKRGARDSSDALIRNSLQWGKQNSAYPLVIEALEMMEKGARKVGNTEKGLGLLQEITLYKDSLFSMISNEIFDETEQRFRNQVLTAELNALNAEHESHRFRQRSLVLGMVAGFLALILVIFWLFVRSRNLKRKGREAELLALSARKESELREAELEKIRLNMQVKEQELVFSSLQKANLHQTARSVMEKLEPFRYRIKSKKDQDDFSQLLHDFHRDSDQDPLAGFEVLFTQMHHNYYEKLLEICPDLSRTELQVCSLLRLNLSSKDIARLTYTSSSSVDVVRSKIRKKLGIDSAASLTSSLIRLG